MDETEIISNAQFEHEATLIKLYTGILMAGKCHNKKRSKYDVYNFSHVL